MENQKMSLIIEGLQQTRINERLDRGFLNRLTKEQKYAISKYIDIDKANFKEITKASFGNLFKREDLMSYDGSDWSEKEIVILSFMEDESVVVTMVRRESHSTSKRPEYLYYQNYIYANGEKPIIRSVTLAGVKATIDISKVSLYADSNKYENFKRTARDMNKINFYGNGPIKSLTNTSTGVTHTGKDIYK